MDWYHSNFKTKMKINLISSILLVSFLATLNSCEGANILAIFPWPSKSHFTLGSTLLHGLAEKGHHVTMISPYPQSKPVQNYRDIVIPDFMKKVFAIAARDKTFSTFFNRKDEDFTMKVDNLYSMGATMTDLCLGHQNVQALLQSKEKFDVVIVLAFMIEAAFALGPHFDAPVIAFSSFVTTEWTDELVGNPYNTAFMPNFFLEYTDHMTFTERFVNSIATIYTGVYREYLYLPKQEALKNKYFPGTPPLRTLLQNTSLLLMNSHISFAYPRPINPNVIEIGGFHMKEPKKLPEDLQKYLDEATDGVIYFSMGSILLSKDFPIEKRQAFMEAFSKLKQKVLWKWEEDELPNQPNNVKVSKWLPQPDVLAHPNVKLFITHGGLLSTIESISRGVPVIGIPIFGDQEINMGRAVRLGFGILLDYHTITADNVYSVIIEILNNPKYSKNVKYRSMLLKDQQVTSMEKAVYWVEYVVRHKGAKHLRSAALDLHWTQVHLLDVIAVLGVVVLGTIGIIWIVCKKLFCIKKSAKKIKQKTN